MHRHRGGERGLELGALLLDDLVLIAVALGQRALAVGMRALQLRLDDGELVLGLVARLDEALVLLGEARARIGSRTKLE